MTDRKECVACRHEIDAVARICPYCGADPESGRRFDPKPILQSHFPARDTAPKARVAELMRERQGLVIAALIVAGVLILGAVHQMITRRNQALESTAPAVPLTDLADLNQPAENQRELPLPDLEFTWTGRPETMDVLLIEPGAAPPATATAPPGQAPAATAPPQGTSSPRTSPPPRPVPTVQGTPRPNAPAPVPPATQPARPPS